MSKGSDNIVFDSLCQFCFLFLILASWIDLNGIWVELPLLVQVLPEGWNLPSYLTIIIQCANIGPLIFTVAVRLAPHKVKDWPVIYLIITIGKHILI